MVSDLDCMEQQELNTKSAICTLFEGDYHYGVGALTNSLYKNGFRGIIWAGYRGALPFWAKPMIPAEKYDEFAVAEGCLIRFVKLETDYHLTNYKPDFMLDLWENYCPEAEYMFYFDPDIVVKCHWFYFEEWAGYGVALCEDVNSPVSSNHPIRAAWKLLFLKYGISLESNLEYFVNGGFVGLNHGKIYFLENWIENLSVIKKMIGSLKNFKSGSRTSQFAFPDQDALNIATMRNEKNASIVGKEGMDFIPGGSIMSHAIGSNKPWKKKFILHALDGRGVRTVDKLFWKNTQVPIKLYTQSFSTFQNMKLILATIISRIIKR